MSGDLCKKKGGRWCACFDPDKELQQIHFRITGDTEIVEMMGLKGAEMSEIASKITKRNEWIDLTGNDMRINIFFVPSRLTSNVIVINETVQVEVHVPATKEHIAYRITGRIKKLLHGYQVGGRKYYFQGQLGDLGTMPGFVCVGSRYGYYATI